jgi:hypothetical protein
MRDQSPDHFSEGVFSDPTSVDSGFTITDEKPSIGGTSFGAGIAYLVQASATAQNPTWTVNAVFYCGGSGSFTFGGGGGGCTDPPKLITLMGVSGKCGDE